MEQSVKSASSYIDQVINQIQNKSSKSVDMRKELQTPSPVKKAREEDLEEKTP